VNSSHSDQQDGADDDPGTAADALAGMAPATRKITGMPSLRR
jgi:hypothetical protein